MESKVTKEELNVINTYQMEENAMAHRLFFGHAENDILFLFQKEDTILYTKEELTSSIDQIKTMYTAIVKNFYTNQERENCTIYKATNIGEIDKLKRNSFVNDFFMAVSDREKAQSENVANLSRPVMLHFVLGEEIPYLHLANGTTLVAPFTQVKKIEEIPDDSEEPVFFPTYQLELELQETEILSEDEKTQLYENILENIDSVNQKLKACVKWDDENAMHYENIRKLEQLLANHHFTMEQENYEQDTTEADKQSDLEDIARINGELTSLKDKTTQICQMRKENANFITDWKMDLITYLKDEFRQIREKYNTPNRQEEQAKEMTTEEAEETPEKELDPTIAFLKSEISENIAIVGTLLTNIKNLIAKQQNHARIAEAIDSNYKALNNAFEMKNFAEELDSLLKAISSKIDIMSPKKDKEALEKISGTNLQVNILLNYLNNAKAGISKRITRFDEISIIEENELKKEIAETIKDIRCEAELRKLRDDAEIIEEKSAFKKFIGRFTGRNKLDETMLDQIQIRQNAIKKTFKTKMPLSYNYSIHELIAEIQMFVKENAQDELIAEEVSYLRRVEKILKKNFVIIDSKVLSIIDQKTGKNLPITTKKITKKELLEIDTYRFLNRYGYDRVNEIKEPEYQDTLANEIKRIVEYIKTSGII